MGRVLRSKLPLPARCSKSNGDQKNRSKVVIKQETQFKENDPVYVHGGTNQALGASCDYKIKL